MAVMNKMREKMTVIFAGLAGAFLLMIVFEWGAQGDFFRSGPKGGEIGEVNGQAITDKEYRDIYDGLRQQKLTQSKKASLSDADDAEVSQQAWDQVITQKLIDQKLIDYGITVTDQEVRDRMYYNPPEDIRRSFVDSTGRFHQDEYWKVLRDPKYDTILTPYTIHVREAMKREKLQSMLQATIRVTNDYMWERYDLQTAKATFDVVKIAPPAASMNEFVSKVTDADLKTYYDAHKWEYKQEEARKIKFVVFRELPTAHDSAAIKDRATTLVKRWKSIPLNETDSVVSDLARDYSDEPYAPTAMLQPKELGTLADADSLLDAQPGQVVLCPTTMGMLKVFRVISSIDSGDELMHLKQIVVGLGKTGAQRDSAKTEADRIMTELRAGGNFAEIARRFSEDPSARQGGDMHWMASGAIPGPALAAVSNAPLGTLVGPIESPMGYQIMMVTGRTRRKLKVQTISLDVKASSQTTKMIQQQANIFKEQAAKKGFDQAAKDMDLRVISDAPPLEKKSQQQLFNYPQFTSYMFGLGVGDISSPVSVASARIVVVAQVVEAIPKGVKPLEGEVKSIIRNAVAKKKMVESVFARAKELRAALGPNDDLSKLTAMDPSLSVQRVTAGPGESTRELGTEYNVNTAVYDLKNPGDITPAIEGTGACYIAKLVSMQPTQKADFEKHKLGLFQNLAKETEQQFFSTWIDNMKAAAKIKDYRIAQF